MFRFQSIYFMVSAPPLFPTVSFKMDRRPEISELENQIRLLGVQLGLENNVLEGLRQQFNNNNTDACRNAKFSSWLKTGNNRSRKTTPRCPEERLHKRDFFDRQIRNIFPTKTHGMQIQCK